MIGTLVNERYRLDAELGRGGMGVVYRAHDTLLGRDVAVKMLSATSLGTEGRARMLHEARAAAQLNHPNVVSIHDAGESEGTPFIIMERLEGEPLHLGYSLREVLSIMRQICAGLEHAHAHGIIHRDLKPENVIVASDGTAKLTDFGLARSVASRITSEGRIVGTVFYLPPEQALGKKIDRRADLYALGVMLYELTTGQLPFTGDDPLAVISQHLYAPVVPPRAKNPEISPALDALIVRLLSKSPEDRPASAADVREVLERVASGAEPPPAAQVVEGSSVLDQIVRGRMVGRERELARAKALWVSATSGEGQMLLVSGEPGIGKTRLVRELVTQVQVSGGTALVGASYAEGGVPYVAFAQMLRTALESGPGEGLNLPGFVLADLLTLAPALCLRYPEVKPNPPLDDPKAEQHRLFENVVICCTALSDRAPLLLAFEDAHWADSGTLSLMRHLARRTRRGRIMIVATYREVELSAALPLHEVLLDLQREQLATRLKLPRLDRTQTGEMMAALFAEEITPEFLEGVYRETEGNPFYVEEVCKALVESGELYYQGGRWHRPSMEELGIPQSVRMAIQSRVRALPTQAQETLHLAAFLGRAFDLGTLAAASDQDEDALVEALESAERAHLIEEVREKGDGRYAFVHALIASTMVEDTRTLQRRRLHRRAAAAIEALHPDSLESLAYHYSQAGQAEKAIEYLLKAGDRARVFNAYQEAIDGYQQALEILREQGDLERAARTLIKLGLTHHNAFQFRAARRAYEESFVLWQRARETRKGGPPPSAPHALRLAVEEPLTLDPSLIARLVSLRVAVQLFSGLVALSPGSGVVPDVAHRWEVLDGGRRYVFHLRDDVRWSDGVPVTAGDFEYAWKRMLNPATGSPIIMPSFMYDVQGARAYHQGEAADPDQVGVRALDDVTLVVDLEEPTAHLLYLVTYLFPVPRHVVHARGTAWMEPGNVVTNGPFRLVAWERGVSMALERCQTYHGRSTGNLQRVELTFGAGEPARVLRMYEQGDLDVVDLFAFPIIEVDRARQRHAAEYVSGPYALAVFAGFDTSRPPFDDRRVRRAFALATDRETLADVALRGYAFPATGGLVPSGRPGHSPGIGLPYDPERACQLLAEAGYPGGHGFPVIESLSFPFPHVGVYLQAQWRENLGIESVWKTMEPLELVDRMSRKRSSVWILWSHSLSPDPDSLLRLFDWAFPTGWQNRAFDRLVEGARRVTDQEERMRMYARADRILVEEALIVPLVYGRRHLLVKPWVNRWPDLLEIGYSFWKDVIIEPHRDRDLGIQDSEA